MRIVQELREPLPAWVNELGEDDFITYDISYQPGKYNYLYEDHVFQNNIVGDMTYSLYDPVKHGADPNGKYPIIMYFHGYSNSLAGDVRISYSGAEYYASPKYQESMGNAYILVPFANEVRGEDGKITGAWDEDYLPVLKGILDEVKEEHKANAGKVIVFGQSGGAWLNWRFIGKYASDITAAFLISGRGIPDDDELKRLDNMGITLFIAQGRHDELIDFSQNIEPRLDTFESLKHSILYFPEWVRNSNGGVSSIYAGVEMGQHCVVNQIQANLMFDDGTFYDPRFQHGITGLIHDIVNK